ncbi:hypothetical protein HDV06_002537 [Boothiomyces sp. JEL0866]|nr:hypothetical protein HDV06_002537 [Boothiomyces sp. JEL0866]
MIYVLLLENDKIYVGYTSRPINERFVEHFNYSGSKWTTLHRPLQVLEVHPGDLKDENAMTLKMMVKYGWWNVRGGSWSQVEINTCPPALLELQQLKLPKAIPNGKNQKKPQSKSSQSPKVTNKVEELSESLIPDKPSKRNVKKSQSKIPRKKECSRCGRDSHTLDECFAKTNIDGTNLEIVESISNIIESVGKIFGLNLTTSESVQFDKDACFRCGRKSHLARNCYAKKDINGKDLE